MDEETRIKIDNLAKNMKEMHLVSTIEEAQQRAKEIILSTAKEGDKSIKELMEEAKGERQIKEDVELLKQMIQTKEKELELLKQELERKKESLEKQENQSEEQITENIEPIEETEIEVREAETPEKE